MVRIIWICWEDIKMLWVKGLSSFTYLFTYMCTCMFVSGCVHVGARRGCPPQSLSIHSFEQVLSRNLELEPFQLVGLEISKPLWSFCLHPSRSWGYRHFTGMPDLSFGIWAPLHTVVKLGCLHQVHLPSPTHSWQYGKKDKSLHRR